MCLFRQSVESKHCHRLASDQLLTIHCFVLQVTALSHPGHRHDVSSRRAEGPGAATTHRVGGLWTRIYHDMSQTTKLRRPINWTHAVFN